jgi:hypothetical protein
VQVRQIWPWIAANHKKATRKPYEKTGAFKLGWKFSTRFAKVSPKVLLLAGLAVSDGIQDDSLDRAERRVFFELHMAQHAQDNHDPGAEAALVKSWSDLIADKQRQPWEIFQAAFSGCSVGQLPGWARKTAASKGAVQLPQVRLLSLFKHFGELPVASAIVEFAGEDVPQTFRQNLRLLQARGDAVDQAKHCAVVKLLTEMENAGHERWVLYRAAYRMHHLWKKVQGAFPAFARPPKGPDSIRVPRSYQRALPEFERLVSEAGILPDSDDDLDVDALAPGDLALLREEVAKSVARCAQPPSVSPPAAKVARTEAAEGSVELQAAPSTVPREIVQDLRHKLGCLSDEELENLWERLGEAGIFPDADDDLDVDALSPVELALLREEVDQSLARCASPPAAKIARIETAGASLAVAAHGGPEVAPDDLAAADEPDAQNGDECDALAGASETGESSEAAGDAEFAAAAPAPAAEAGRALAPAAEAEPSPAPAPALAAEAEPAPAPDPAPAAGAGPAPAPAPAPAAEAGPAPEPQEIVEDLMHKLACLSVAESENLWERLGAAGILPDDAGDDHDLDVDALSPEDLALLREEVAKSFARCAQPPVSPSPPRDAKRLEISPDEALELDATSNGRDAGDVAEPAALAPALADEEEMFGELEAELGAA